MPSNVYLFWTAVAIPMIQYVGWGRFLRRPAAISVLVGMFAFVVLGPAIEFGSSLHGWATVMVGQWILILIAAWIFRLIVGRFPIDQFGVFPDNPGTAVDRVYQYLLFMGLAIGTALILRFNLFA